MTMFILWVCGGLLVFLAPGHCAPPKCTKVDDCACELEDGKQINIRSLGYQGDKAPRFPYTASTGPYDWTYAFNPCYDFSDKYCKDVIACQKAPNKDDAFPLGSASTAEWGIDGDNYKITYTDVDKKRTTIVDLVCSESATEPKLDVIGQKDATNTIYYFTLTSKCACPGACEKAPTMPTQKPSSGGGISTGSIICIVFSVLVIGYFVGGVLFMKFGRHAEGRDVVPNVGFWTELPGTIKDGAKFSVSFFRRGGKYDEL